MALVTATVAGRRSVWAAAAHWSRILAETASLSGRNRTLRGLAIAVPSAWSALVRGRVAADTWLPVPDRAVVSERHRCHLDPASRSLAEGPPVSWSVGRWSLRVDTPWTSGTDYTSSLADIRRAAE